MVACRFAIKLDGVVDVDDAEMAVRARMERIEPVSASFRHFACAMDFVVQNDEHPFSVCLIACCNAHCLEQIQVGVRAQCGKRTLGTHKYDRLFRRHRQMQKVRRLFQRARAVRNDKPVDLFFGQLLQNEVSQLKPMCRRDFRAAYVAECRKREFRNGTKFGDLRQKIILLNQAGSVIFVIEPMKAFGGNRPADFDDMNVFQCCFLRLFC